MFLAIKQPANAQKSIFYVKLCRGVDCTSAACYVIDSALAISRETNKWLKAW